jgi:4-alpha-glucanotransferase
MQRLEHAHQRFLDGKSPQLQEEFERFLDGAGAWLDDFATYQAILEAHEGKHWHQWDEALRNRQPDELDRARRQLDRSISYHKFEQFLFDRQWDRLRDHARSYGISIMGDIPIYVALDSADVWANQDQFLLTAEGKPEVQAGVPPDLFSETGQLWGNPVYDWDRMRETGAWAELTAALRVRRFAHRRLWPT